MTHHPAYDFPLLDCERQADTRVCNRVVCDVFRPVEARLPDLDTWRTMPVRLSYSQAAGFYLELGPYDLDAADIGVLRRAIAAYDAAVGQ